MPPARKANPGLQDFLSRECPSNRHKNTQPSAPPPKTGFWFEPSGSEALGGILKPGGWQLAPQLDGIEGHAEGINICYYKIGFDLILDLHAIPATMALLITKRPMVSDPCLLHAKPLTIMNRNGHLSCYILCNSFPKNIANGLLNLFIQISDFRWKGEHWMVSLPAVLTYREWYNDRVSPHSITKRSSFQKKWCTET